MIQVTNIKASRTDAQATLSAEIHSPGCSLDTSALWLRYPAQFYDCLSSTADPWLALLLWPAMRIGRDLQVDAPASPRLLAETHTLMDIMHCWDPRLKPINVRTEGTASDRRTGTAVASFFSGGVDSFHTALKNTAPHARTQTRITHLISVKGLDVRLPDDALWTRVRTRLSAAAADLDCTWIECATNVRELISQDLIAWPMYHGAVLAGIALGLPAFWRTVLIPADHTYAQMVPSGSHPLVNPLWSTEAVRIACDGAEVTRIEKIVSQIARSDVALRHLRVCWKNPEGRYNCATCEKCIRTMVGLQIAGALERCRSFDRPLNYRAISRVTLRTPGQRNLMAQNYRAARAAGANRRLVRALKRCVDPSPAWKARRLVGRGARRVARQIDRCLLAGRLRAWYHRPATPDRATPGPPQTSNRAGNEQSQPDASQDRLNVST